MFARLFLAALFISCAPQSLRAAEPPIVIHGDEQTRLDLALVGGGLEPARGVANIQVFRASRAAADLTDGKGWTYHHHVDLAAWHGRLYLAWDSCEKDEDVWPSRELYATSTDGFNWSPPAELFPQGVSTASRMYFFHAPNGRMLAIAGLRTDTDNLTEKKKGALVVREISADHALGPVRVLRPPADTAQAKDLPPYQRARDDAFVRACDQLLANKPFLEQADYGYALDANRRMKWHDVKTWPADEPSRDRFDRFGKAMSFYHRKDGAMIALMKWGWVLVSRDEGESWSPPVRPPTFVSGMAKAWGQRTGDGRYALVYDPDLERRYPLVVVHGDDGINFRDMRTVHADVPPLRYPGRYKSPGPQYVRGISEWSSDGSWKDAANALWVCYSVNKEDIWISRVPLPPGGDATRKDAWNTYSPKWAPVTIAQADDGEVVRLEDRDPADYARASRLLTMPMRSLEVTFDLRMAEGATEPLCIDLIGPRGGRAATITVKPTDLPPGEWRAMRLRADCATQSATARLDTQPATTHPFAALVAALTRIDVRTGDRAAPASAEADHPADPSRCHLRNMVIR
jgi:hypothetical protein